MAGNTISKIDQEIQLQHPRVERSPAPAAKSYTKFPEDQGHG